MEILENVQVLDDSFLAEVSGGVEWKAAAGKEAAGKFFDTWFGWAVTGVAGVATIALSVLGTIFLPKTPKAVATVASKGWFGEKAKGWGDGKLAGYAHVPSAEDFEGNMHLYDADNKEIPLGEGQYIAVTSKVQA